MQPIRLALLAALVAGLSAAPARGRSRRSAKVDQQAARSPKRVLRIATLLPSGTSWMRVFRRFAQRVQRRSGGTLRIRYYPNAMMGDEKDMVAKMRRGRLHGGALTGVGLGSIVGEVRALELPYMFERPAVLFSVRGQLQSALQARFNKAGFELLAWGDVGWIHFFSRKPMRTRAHIRELRAWSWVDDPLAQAMVKRLDVKGVPLAIQGVLPALQSGIIDTVYGSPYTTLSLQWHTQVRTMSAEPITFAQAAVIVTRKALAQLSPAQRRVLRQQSRWLAAQHRRSHERDNRAARKQLLRMGIAAHPAAPALKRWLRSRSKFVWRELAGKLYPRAWLARLLKLRDATRTRLGRSARHH